MQHYLIELAKRDNVSLKGLQLDILRNEGHNLHKEEVWAWVSQQLQEGLVDLFLVAPPCTTHSRARCQYRQHGGPRPLRDFNFPHGYPWLAMPTEKKFSWPMNWCRNLSQAAFWHASGTSTSFWNTQSNWGERPGKSPPVFGIFQRRPSSCCKKGFVRLRFFSVNFLLLLQSPLGFLQHWIL